MKEWKLDGFTEKQYNNFILKGAPMRYGFRFAVNYRYFDCMIHDDYTLTDLIMN